MDGAGKILSFLLILFLLTGCDDPVDIPPPSQDAPEFFVEGVVNAQTFKFVAGENGYYMFTSFTQDSLGVLIFKGRLAFWDCLTFCPNSIAIEIRDFQNFNETGTVEMTDALSPTRNFSFFKEDNPDTTHIGIQQFSTVRISYFDGQGTVYLSSTIDQGPDSYFHVKEISDFIDNRFEEPTKKVELEFSADLESAFGDKISIQEASGLFAFSFPGD